MEGEFKPAYKVPDANDLTNAWANPDRLMKSALDQVRETGKNGITAGAASLIVITDIVGESGNSSIVPQGDMDHAIADRGFEAA